MSVYRGRAEVVGTGQTDANAPETTCRIQSNRANKIPGDAMPKAGTPLCTRLFETKLNVKIW
ncbi:hypothetical protein EAS61_01730 [Bradyrhizobium zhanjiangense]|uniref:Uncharacterized protein n=1 Tax=Bradyrhizobium zhanjiangense TaxID=1325107 RepID=A0A4Q0QZV5_9BRAD|nr:hypothetical protein EAS61_01730 [Bradyrhizobium zhanjiangense]